MQIKIGEKEYELNFGVKFVRLLDQTHGLSVNGMQFGQGLTKMLYGLQAYDPACLADVIYAATWANKKRPTLVQIEAMIEDPETDIEKLFDNVIAEMNKSNAIKVASKKMKA